MVALNRRGTAAGARPGLRLTVIRRGQSRAVVKPFTVLTGSDGDRQLSADPSCARALTPSLGKTERECAPMVRWGEVKAFSYLAIGQARGRKLGELHFLGGGRSRARRKDETCG